MQVKQNHGRMRCDDGTVCGWFHLCRPGCQIPLAHAASRSSFDSFEIIRNCEAWAFCWNVSCFGDHTTIICLPCCFEPTLLQCMGVTWCHSECSMEASPKTLNLEDGHSGSWKLSCSVSTRHLSALGVFCEFSVQAMDFHGVLTLHLSSGVLTSSSSKRPSAGDEQSHKVESTCMFLSAVAIEGPLTWTRRTVASRSVFRLRYDSLFWIFSQCRISVT